MSENVLTGKATTTGGSRGVIGLRRDLRWLFPLETLLATSALPSALSSGHRLNASRLQVRNAATSAGLLVGVLFPILQLVDLVERQPVPIVGMVAPVLKEGHQLVGGRGPIVSTVLVAVMNLHPEVATPPVWEQPGVIIHSPWVEDVPMRKEEIRYKRPSAGEGKSAFYRIEVLGRSAKARAS